MNCGVPRPGPAMVTSKLVAVAVEVVVVVVAVVFGL